MIKDQKLLLIKNTLNMFYKDTQANLLVENGKFTGLLETTRKFENLRTGPHRIEITNENTNMLKAIIYKQY